MSRLHDRRREARDAHANERTLELVRQSTASLSGVPRFVSSAFSAPCRGNEHAAFSRPAHAERWLAWPLLYAVSKMQMSVKGMIQVHSVTYRIVRVRAGQYDVVRLLDDARIGSFSLGNGRDPLIEGDAQDLLRAVARAALQGGRTTWAPRRLSA